MGLFQILHLGCENDPTSDLYRLPEECTTLPESYLDGIFGWAGNSLRTVGWSLLLALYKPARVHKASDLSLCTEMLQLTGHPLNVQQNTCPASTAGEPKTSVNSLASREMFLFGVSKWQCCHLIIIGTHWNHVINLTEIFTVTGQGPLIDIMSLFTVDCNHLYCWQEDAAWIGLLLINGRHGDGTDGQRTQALV